MVSLLVNGALVLHLNAALKGCGRPRTAVHQGALPSSLKGGTCSLLLALSVNV